MGEGQRFISTGPFDLEMPYYYLMIKDFTWWLDNEPKVYSWMEQHLPRGRLHHEGMVITFTHAKECSMFLLKWGG